MGSSGSLARFAQRARLLILSGGGNKLDSKEQFEAFYQCHFGNQELYAPVFYRFPVGIRFEIGTGDIYDEAYVQNAIHRAIAVFTELFNKNDAVFVVIDSFEDDPNDLANADISVVRPLLHDVQSECKFSFATVESEFVTTRYLLCCVVKDIQIERLTEAIVRSDIDGSNGLRGGVYLMNQQSGVIYYLYDDRGLDVVSATKEKLTHIYEKFDRWILAYDRKRIDSTFAE